MIDYVKAVLSAFKGALDISNDGKHLDIHFTPSTADDAAQAVGAEGHTYKAVRQLFRAVAKAQGLTAHYYVHTDGLVGWRGNQ
jgi:predicted RNA-binding protein Jag